jgi:hypothetical protein
MNIFRLLLFFLFGLLVRRTYLSFKSRIASGPAGPAPGSGTGGGNSQPGPGQVPPDLTEQDISDADFEEIP